ncbi:MAG TPA: vWA domain-containing protein, partial [Gemmata sp.]|nr:vWA domain-containing protein [Gemmata sp.]
QLIERPDPHAWWNSFRAAGDTIGTQFCGLAAAVKTNADQATRTATLKEAGPSLAKAATLARLIDPAAPLLPGLDPVAVDLRFRRHAMLLWHAQRTTTEGWADVAQTTPDGWYCRKVAKLLIDSAQALILEDATELTDRPAENFSPGELDRWVSDCRTEASRRPIVLKLTAERDQTVADEPTWSFAFNLMVPDKDKDAVGFPVSWLDAPPAHYPQPAPGSIGRRVEPDFVRGRATATRPVKFTAIGPPADVAGSGKFTSTVLYRGHLYQQPTEVVLVGTPTREWVYTPPKGPACFAIRAERAEVAGAVTILIDLTASMTTHIFPKDKTTPTRLEEAKKGLQLVLKQLPRGTTVTLAYFYGDKTFKIATVKPYGVPVVMDGSNWERVYAAFKDEKAEGQSTPLAGAIREVLIKENAKDFWPKDFTGSRTLIVLTDGEDNWEYEKKEPGQVVLDTLRNKHNNPDDVNLHIIFFGLTSDEDLEEQQRALKQFEVLRRPEQFRDPPRTPGQLWPGVREAKALAELCRGAMLPQFPYSSGKQLADRLEATVPEEGVLRTTPAIEPLVYDLWGLNGPQAIQLRPADRVLFQARRRDDAFELFLPPYAYETATKANPPRPRATTGTAATGGILGTIPELTGVSGSNDTGLSLTVTLEPSGERRAANLLEVTRPKFVWFDVAYEDGKPAPYVGIENRSPVWAPAWNLNLARWEPGGTALSKVRHPVVSGFWLDGFPVPDAGYPVNLNDLPGSLERLEKVRTVRVRDCDVNLLSVTREEYSDSSLPKGEYLTIRMKYGKPGELVFVRPGNLKGTKQPYTLYERHVYYDAQTRYTARFGPIFDTDLNKDITLDLYAVAGLREASVRSSRSVTVRFPAGELETLKMPQELTVPPRKE